MNKRITTIDGLRAFAVLGVLWAHCWMFFNNIPLTIIKVPINNLISFVGVGVDIFFVISGFCMYYTFQRKYVKINMVVFLDFVKNRWLRIAPLFYIAVMIYSIDIYFKSNVFPFSAILSHLFFIQTLVDQNIIASHFWSLATEWHFYLILPIIFHFGSKKFGIYKITAYLMLFSLALRLFHWGYILDSPLSIENYDRIYLRFVEFGWGILACKMYLDNIVLPEILLGAKGFIIAFIIAYAGRILNSTEAINIGGANGYIIKAFSEPVMTLGFSILLLNTIQSSHLFTRLLNTQFFQKIGKVSYSFYLWHWLICSYVCKFCIECFGKNNWFLEIAFILSSLITYLISIISYEWVELKFLKQKLENETNN